MTENNSNSIVHTNINVFYNIAKKAYVAMNEDLNSGREPKPGGEPVFLESLLHLLIVKRKGLTVFKKYDRSESYEGKLQLLGCNDQSILAKCKHYRNARREVVHEKAHINNEKILVAQKEATYAMDLINEILTYFNLDMG
jgi:hypothetical protein